MTIDRNRAKLGGKVAPEWPAGVPPMVPEFPVHDWEATDLVSTSRVRTEQQKIKEGVNDPSIREQLSPVSGRQIPQPPASAAEFQPLASDTVKQEVRYEHGAESDYAFAGVDVQPGKVAGGLPEDASFSAKTRLVGDMVTGPDPKAQDIARKQITAVLNGTLMAGGDFPMPRVPRVPIKDWPKDEEKEFVQNAPDPGKEL